MSEWCRAGFCHSLPACESIMQPLLAPQAPVGRLSLLFHPSHPSPGIVNLILPYRRNPLMILDKIMGSYALSSEGDCGSNFGRDPPSGATTKSSFESRTGLCVLARQGTVQRNREFVRFRYAAPTTALMAATFTMSLTLQPRERSNAGLRKPCTTGPMASAPPRRCASL